MRRVVATAMLVVALCAPGSAVAEHWAPATPAVFVADFVSTAADGIDMNDGGDVTGTSYPDPGCGSFCLPPLDTVVWRASGSCFRPSRGSAA